MRAAAEDMREPENKANALRMANDFEMLARWADAEPGDPRNDEEYLRDVLQGMAPLGCFYAITIKLTQNMSLPFRGNFSTDEKCLRDILQPKSPLWLPDWIMAGLTARKSLPLGWTGKSIALAMTSGQPSPEQLAELNALADARRRMLEASTAFRAALARIEAAGVAHHWTGFADYGYTSRELSLSIPLDAIPRLQHMAADDAGIDKAEERRQAAESYRRWLLQHYHRDWKAYQQRWPLIEQSPYNTARNDFGRDANPIRP
jgi:hypothetical protein